MLPDFVTLKNAVALHSDHLISLPRMAESDKSSITSSSPSNGILELITYNREHHEKHCGISAEDILKHVIENRVNWINVDGLNNQDIIERIQAHFCLHSLVVDDVLSDQRPKAEEFDDYLFFTLKMLYRIDGTHIDYEQISFVLGKNYLISFQEKKATGSMASGSGFDWTRDAFVRRKLTICYTDSSTLLSTTITTSSIGLVTSWKKLKRPSMKTRLTTHSIRFKSLKRNSSFCVRPCIRCAMR